MLWKEVLKLLVLASLSTTGQSTYDCQTYDKRPGTCTSAGHCRDFCPGNNLTFLRYSLAMPFDDPACAQPGIFSNARQVCCPKLKCPQKVPELNIFNTTNMEYAENLIRTRRSSDTQDKVDSIASDTNDGNGSIKKDLSNYYMLLFNRSHENIRHHTTYITHTIYHETRFTLVQTSTQTHFHTYNVPDQTTIVFSTVEFFTTLPVTHVTRSTITALPDLPTSTITKTDLIHVYTDFLATKTLTTTVYGHTINKTSTFTPLCDDDINVKKSSILTTKTHTVSKTIISTRTNLRTYVTSHYLSLTSYRSSTYISTVTQTRVIRPTHVIYTTITADVADLTKTAYTATVNVKETLIVPSTFPIGTQTLTETVYSSETAQYHTIIATDCTKTKNTENEDITTQLPLTPTTEDITPTAVMEELDTEDLSTVEIPETSIETSSEAASEISEETTTSTSATTMGESTTINNDIGKGTRTKNNAFCAIPSKKEKYAKLKVITCGTDQKNVICRKNDRRTLPENSVVLVTCYGSFTQWAKCGHDSKWRPYQISHSNNFTESFTLCDIEDKQ
ncbi:unnamed protein product [Meganyctiphanes norvegica]|uniref:Uncharacterized protein n=1 Tax=Meganyctiphanes norvegica TaxID=48144 RepID=A0AAV2SE12_MEGNR